MSSKKFFCICGFSIVVLIGGCSDFSSSVSPVTPTNTNSEILTLGNKLENPYSVKNILRARDSLVARGVLSKSAIANESLTPTHYYIRFKPMTDSQCVLIKKDSTLVLWDYPLDYEIPTEGTVYRDPEIPEGQPSYQYTAIPIGSITPPVKYEILEELILEPEEDEAILNKRVPLYNLLEQEALRITGNLKSSSNTLKKVMGKWNPSGSILVYDEILNRNMPIAGVDVRVRNWFKWWDGNTDDNGNFYCSKGYLGDVAYSLRWNYPDRFDIRSGKTGQAFYNGPNNKRGRWDLLISSDMSRVYAHIFRAGAYYTRSEPFGLRDKPFDLISIQAMDEVNPHTDKDAYYKGTNENIRIWRWDNAGVTYPSIDLFANTCHELGHAEHDEIYDGSYYYAITDKRLIESWAVAVEYFLTSSIYGADSYLRVTGSRWDVSRQGWWNGKDNYTPIMIDLIDNFNQGYHYIATPPAQILNDNITGYTLNQMETIISHGGCKTLNDFKNEISVLPLPPGVTPSMLQIYLNQY